jgi:hypothetical protein
MKSPRNNFGRDLFLEIFRNLFRSFPPELEQELGAQIQDDARGKGQLEDDGLPPYRVEDAVGAEQVGRDLQWKHKKIDANRRKNRGFTIAWSFSQNSFEKSHSFVESVTLSTKVLGLAVQVFRNLWSKI